jgi:hypothetical protein
MAEPMSKVVLISITGYHQKHDVLLLSYLDQEFELFSVVGKDCELWEEVMDELAVGDGSNSRYISTTSHPGEKVEDVFSAASSLQIRRC